MTCQPRMTEVAWTAFAVAMIVSIVSGMLVAMVGPMIVKAVAGG